jgi:hypothetical protein
MVGKGGCGWRGLAVNAVLAGDPRVIACRRRDARPQCDQAQRALHVGGDRPRAVPFRKRGVFKGRAAQTTPRRKKRNRLDQIGLAGAIRSDQHDRPGANCKLRGAVAAKIRQAETPDTGGGHARISNQE